MAAAASPGAAAVAAAAAAAAAAAVAAVSDSTCFCRRAKPSDNLTACPTVSKQSAVK